MGNSIIDNQLDRSLLARSPYNGNYWVRNFLTGENPPAFYLSRTGEKQGIDDLFKEIQSMLGNDKRKIIEL